MGRVMGCGLCPYNAIEKVGNYAIYMYFLAVLVRILLCSVSIQVWLPVLEISQLFNLILFKSFLT